MGNCCSSDSVRDDQGGRLSSSPNTADEAERKAANAKKEQQKSDSKPSDDGLTDVALPEIPDDSGAIHTKDVEIEVSTSRGNPPQAQAPTQAQASEQSAPPASETTTAATASTSVAPPPPTAPANPAAAESHQPQGVAPMAPPQELTPEKRAKKKRDEMEIFAEETNFSADEIQELIKKFENIACSEDDDGLIDKHEFMTALGVDGGLFYERMFDIFDVDKSGCIDCREFLQGLSVFSKKATRDQKIQFLFKIWDQNGDGAIEEAELKRMLLASLGTHQFGEDLINSLVAESFRTADTNGDGQIDFEEFSNLCKTSPQMLELMTLELPTNK